LTSNLTPGAAASAAARERDGSARMVGLVVGAVVVALAADLFGVKPFLALPVVAGGGFILGRQLVESTYGRITEQTPQSCAEHLRSVRHEHAAKVAELATAGLKELADAVDQQMVGDIERLRAPAQAMEAERQREQELYREAVRQLDRSRAQAQAVR